MEVYRSTNYLGIYNEFGQEGLPQDKNEVVTNYDKQLEVSRNLFVMIVNTSKDKWTKFMGIIDQNLSKLKNRIDVARDMMERNNLKIAFTKMAKVKNFNNPMKRILYKANMAFAKIKRSKNPEEIAEGKQELMDLRAQQKEIIGSAKTALAESKDMLGSNKDVKQPGTPAK